MRDVLALTWSEHRRTTELCAGLGVELIVLGTSHRAALRYLLLGARTIRQLMRRRPRVLLVPNPSLVLSALAVMVRAVLGYMLVVDAHNEAIAPFIHRQQWVKGLSRWVIRKADLTLVSNEQLTEQVVLQGGRAFALADRVPVPPPATAQALHGRFNAVLIATFAPDEPVAAVLEAVRSVDVELYVTGNERELDRAIAAKTPRNVRFTGFLAEADYWRLLRSADAIIDLTLMNNCLVCGAYEALALGKPMLLSKNAASVEFFGECAVFTDNTVADIRAALERLKLEYARLQAGAEGRRSELMDQWIGSARELQELLDASPARVNPLNRNVDER